MMPPLPPPTPPTVTLPPPHTPPPPTPPPADVRQATRRLPRLALPAGFDLRGRVSQTICTMRTTTVNPRSRTMAGIVAAAVVVVGCAVFGLRLLSHDDAATATAALGPSALDPQAAEPPATDMGEGFPEEGAALQWKLDAIDLRDQEGHFDGTATISFQGMEAQPKTFTIMLFQGQSQVATLRGQAAVAPGTPATVELDSQDPFVAGTTGYVLDTAG